MVSSGKPPPDAPRSSAAPQSKSQNEVTAPSELAVRLVQLRAKSCRPGRRAPRRRARAHRLAHAVVLASMPGTATRRSGIKTNVRGQSSGRLPKNVNTRSDCAKPAARAGGAGGRRAGGGWAGGAARLGDKQVVRAPGVGRRVRLLARRAPHLGQQPVRLARVRLDLHPHAQRAPGRLHLARGQARARSRRRARPACLPRPQAAAAFAHAPSARPDVSAWRTNTRATLRRGCPVRLPRPHRAEQPGRHPRALRDRRRLRPLRARARAAYRCCTACLSHPHLASCRGAAAGARSVPRRCAAPRNSGCSHASDCFWAVCVGRRSCEPAAASRHAHSYILLPEQPGHLLNLRTLCWLHTNH